jgi:hypothetical protein
MGTRRQEILLYYWRKVPRSTSLSLFTPIAGNNVVCNIGVYSLTRTMLDFVEFICTDIYKALRMAVLYN